MLVELAVGKSYDRDALLRDLVDIQYERNDYELSRGKFRVRGDVIEVRPSYEEKAIRIEYFGDEIEKLSTVDLVTRRVLESLTRVAVYPAKHFVTTQENIDRAIDAIQDEADEQIARFRSENKLIEAQRIGSRTRYDIEMLREMGYCSGIENYSRHLTGRAPGERPAVLLDYFPDDFLLFIDESHVSVPQIRGMYRGDRARKETLVKFGFRLPSALDNRPLMFDEFEGFMKNVIFVSATPGSFELEACGGVIVEQVIRPTGLVDPEIVIRPVSTQVDDLLEEIRKVTGDGERVLVTTLTKRMSEDLTDYLHGLGIRVRYLHSDIAALERIEIIRGLRLGEFDVLVGINLLREGLDLPEVSLVAVLDADKEGFLRSDTSLIQTSGRAARHLGGRVIFYADKVTGSMDRAITEMSRRRAIQMKHNETHGIIPEGIIKSVEEIVRATAVADARSETNEDVEFRTLEPGLNLEQMIEIMHEQMMQAAEELDFEKAAGIRDRIDELKMTHGIGLDETGEGKDETPPAKPGASGSVTKARGRTKAPKKDHVLHGRHEREKRK
jgi:excinuclease ABC subunit B